MKNISEFQLGMREEKLLEYMKKYVDAELYVISEVSENQERDWLALLNEVENDYDCDIFINVATGESLGILEFRNFMFPDYVIAAYEKSME